MKWRTGEKSAEQENRQGMFLLGQCYEAGTGVARDLRRALELYRAAAAQGSEPAREALERLGDRDGSPSRRGGFWRELLDGFRHR